MGPANGYFFFFFFAAAFFFGAAFFFFGATFFFFGATFFLPFRAASFFFALATNFFTAELAFFAVLRTDFAAFFADALTRVVVCEIASPAASAASPIASTAWFSLARADDAYAIIGSK